MGDHRATIKLEFQIYQSETFTADWSINYIPEYTDEQILEWFHKHYYNARAEWEAQLEKEDEERRSLDKERGERALLAELDALKDAVRWAFTDGYGSIRHVFHEAPGTDTDKIHAETLRKVLAGDARQIRRLDPDESIDYQEMLLAALNRGKR